MVEQVWNGENMKKYLILVDGLFALLGDAVNVSVPYLIFSDEGMGAYKYTIRIYIALNLWNVISF